MSIFRPVPGGSNRLKPGIESLEGRVCPVKCFPTPSGGVFCFPSGPPTLPRTGGAAFVSGSVLIVVTNHSGANQATIQDDGAGNVTVEWNGHTPPTFHGITRIVLDGKGRKNVFDYILTGNVTVPHEVDVLLHGNHSTFGTANEGLGNFNTKGLTFEVLTYPPPASLAKGF